MNQARSLLNCDLACFFSDCSQLILLTLERTLENEGGLPRTIALRLGYQLLVPLQNRLQIEGIQITHIVVVLFVDSFLGDVV